MSLSLLRSNNREEISAMQQMDLGHLFTYFQWCWKAEAQREVEEEDKEHRGLKKEEESGGIWPAGVSSRGSPRSSGRELLEGLQGRERKQGRKNLQGWERKTAKLTGKTNTEHKRITQTQNRKSVEDVGEVKVVGKKRWVRRNANQ